MKDDLTGRDILTWLTAHPEFLDLPVMLLSVAGPEGDSVVANEIDYDVFNPVSGKKWIVLLGEHEVGGDD